MVRMPGSAAGWLGTTSPGRSGDGSFGFFSVGFDGEMMFSVWCFNGHFNAISMQFQVVLWWHDMTWCDMCEVLILCDDFSMGDFVVNSRFILIRSTHGDSMVIGAGGVDSNEP